MRLTVPKQFHESKRSGAMAHGRAAKGREYKDTRRDRLVRALRDANTRFTQVRLLNVNQSLITASVVHDENQNQM